MEGLLKYNKVFSDFKKYNIETLADGDFTTDINVNRGYRNTAVVYLMQYFTGDGDSTACDFGLLRFGYSGNHVTKYKLGGNVDCLQVAATPEGLLKFSFKINGLHASVLIMG